MLKLRDYQQAQKEETLREFAKGYKNVMFQAPTGAGKTVSGVDMLHHYYKLDPHAVYAWMTDRQLLRTQSGAQIEKLMPVVDHSQMSAGRREWVKGAVNIFSPTLKMPEMPKGSDAGLLVVDEAHHGTARTWSRAIQNWNGRVLGLTATVWRMSDKQGFQKEFDTLVPGPQIVDLIETINPATGRAYLAQPIVLSPSKRYRVNTNNLDNSTTNASGYTDESTDREVQRLLRAEDLPRAWARLCDLFPDIAGNRQTLWYSPSINSAELLCEELRKDDWGGAAMIDADTPYSTRELYLDMLEAGTIRHVVSVNTIGEGVNLPAIPVVAWVRPSKSVVQWFQACGRAMRPKESGKCLILDFAGTAYEIGLPDEPREWSLLPRDKQGSKGLRKYPPGQCIDDDCPMLVHPSMRNCPLCDELLWWDCAICGRARRYTNFADRDVAECRDCRMVRRRRNDWFKQAASGQKECFYSLLGLDFLLRDGYTEESIQAAYDSCDNRGDPIAETALLTLRNSVRRELYDNLRQAHIDVERAYEEYWSPDVNNVSGRLIHIEAGQKIVWQQKRDDGTWGWIRCTPLTDQSGTTRGASWITRRGQRVSSISEATKMTKDYLGMYHNVNVKS